MFGGRFLSENMWVRRMIECEPRRGVSEEGCAQEHRGILWGTVVEWCNMHRGQGSMDQTRGPFTSLPLGLVHVEGPSGPHHGSNRSLSCSSWSKGKSP